MSRFWLIALGLTGWLMLAGLPRHDVIGTIHSLLAAGAATNPAMVYLRPEDVAATVHDAIENRGPEWLAERMDGP